MVPRSRPSEAVERRYAVKVRDGLGSPVEGTLGWGMNTFELESPAKLTPRAQSLVLELGIDAAVAGGATDILLHAVGCFDHTPSLLATSCATFRELSQSDGFGENACVATDSDEMDSALKQRAVLRERLQRRRTRTASVPFVILVILLEVHAQLRT